MSTIFLTLIILCLAALPAGSLAVNASLGSAVSLTAGVVTTIDFLAGPTVIISSSADCEVTVSAFASTSVDLPPGYTALSFGSNVGYTFTTNPSSVTLTKLELSTPALSIASAALLTGSVQAGCLQFKSTISAYGNVAIKSYNVSTKQITVDLPGQGTYVLVAVSQTQEVPALWGSVEFSAHSSKTFNYPGFSVSYNASAAVKVTVAKSHSTAHATLAPEGKVSLGEYFTVTANSSASAEAVLKVKYTQAMLDQFSVSASTLRLAFWSNNGWYFEDAGFSLDTSAMVASQTTTRPEAEWTLVAGAGGVIPLLGSLGTPVAVDAGAETSIDFALGPQLKIKSASAGKVTVSGFASTTVALPSGYSAISLGANVGYTVETQFTSVTMDKLQLTTPALSAAAAGQITGSVSAGCLQFNSSLSAYGKVDIESYDVATKKITVNLPAQGTYVLVTVSQTTQIPSLWGSVVVTAATRASTYNFPAGFSLNVDTSVPVKVTASWRNHTTSGVAQPEGKVSLGQYFSVSSNASASSSTAVTLKASYTPELLAQHSVPASSLRFAAKVNGKWYYEATGFSVDTSSRVVTQTSTRLSGDVEWMLVGGDGGVTPLLASLGAATSVQANTETSIDLDLGARLLVKASADSTVKVSALVETTTILPSGYHSLSTGGSVGYSVETSASATTLELTSAPLTAAAAAQLTGSTKAAVLQYDAEAKFYGLVHTAVNYTASTRQVALSLPAQGTYVLVAASLGAALPTHFGTAVGAEANVEAQFAYPSGFSLKLTPSAPLSLTTSLSATTTYAVKAPVGTVPLGVYLKIEPNTTASVSATLQMQYTASMLAQANVSASSLRFAFYDTAKAAWTMLDSGFSVDTTAKVVTQTTTHFSEWALVGSGGGSFCALSSVSLASSYFSGWSASDICASMGTALIAPDLPDAPPTPEPSTPSASFDWRATAKGSACFATPRSQGKCGSCWAFASSTALAQRDCIKAGLTSSLSLSPQHILNCDATCDGDRCQQGCNGGYPDLVWKFLDAKGTASDTCRPYEGAKKPCTSGACAGGAGAVVEYRSTNGYRLSSVTKMQLDIEQRGPIMASMLIKEDFLDYKSGVYTASSSARDIGGHAVTVLGWGTEGGTDYWLCENSWGASWGMDGYFKIRRGTNEVRIEEFATAGEANTTNVKGGSPQHVESAGSIAAPGVVVAVAAALFAVVAVL